MSASVRVGIVGSGAIVQVAHLPVLKKLKGVTVAGLCDTDMTKARALAQRYDIPVACDDIQELIAQAECDAILICTPNHLHEAHILTAIAAGTHVLVEKPLALTPTGAQRIIKAADKSGRTVMVSVNHRYRPDTQAVRAFVQGGELGDIDSVRASWHLARPARAQLGWRQRRDQAGGGAMTDLGITMLDLCFWLAGHPMPKRVSASFGVGARDRAVEQSADVFIVCDNGTSIFLDVTWRHIGAGEHFGVGLRGTKGTAGINPLHVWKEMNGVPHDVSPTGSGSRENVFTASFRAQWAHFLAAIRGEAPAADLAEQAYLLKILEAIYRSAEEGKDIPL